MTTIAPTANPAPVASPTTRTLDRAAVVIFGIMVTLIVLLTVVLLETTFRNTPTATDDGAAFPPSVIAQTAAAR